MFQTINDEFYMHQIINDEFYMEDVAQRRNEREHIKIKLTYIVSYTNTRLSFTT